MHFSECDDTSLQDRRLTLLLRAAWATSCLLALPQLFVFSMQPVDDDGTLDCWAHFDGEVRQIN